MIFKGETYSLVDIEIKKGDVFVFISDGSVNLNGWEATISCSTPCQNVQANLVSSNPVANASGEIKIETPFFVKLPKIVSRLGHSGKHFEITQWYPKPAVNHICFSSILISGALSG